MSADGREGQLARSTLGIGVCLSGGKGILPLCCGGFYYPCHAVTVSAFGPINTNLQHHHDRRPSFTLLLARLLYPSDLQRRYPLELHPILQSVIQINVDFKIRSQYNCPTLYFKHGSLLCSGIVLRRGPTAPSFKGL